MVFKLDILVVGFHLANRFLSASPIVLLPFFSTRALFLVRFLYLGAFFGLSIVKFLFTDGFRPSPNSIPGSFTDPVLTVKDLNQAFYMVRWLGLDHNCPIGSLIYF